MKNRFASSKIKAKFAEAQKLGTSNKMSKIRLVVEVLIRAVFDEKTRVGTIVDVELLYVHPAITADLAEGKGGLSRMECAV